MAHDEAYKQAEQKIAEALKMRDPLSFSPKSDDSYFESAYIFPLVIFGGDAEGRGGRS